MSILWSYFRVIDFSLGALVPLTVLVLYRRKKISPFTWRIFRAGAALSRILCREGHFSPILFYAVAIQRKRELARITNAHPQN